MTRLAIIGFGKIAKDSHVPTLRRHGFDLRAVVTRGAGPEGVRCFATPDELFAGMRGEIDAVAICTPPGPRTAIALKAIDEGLDLLLEKPPATTLGEIAEVIARAEASGRVLYTTWHSQHAAAVARVAGLLRGKRIAELRINWREDVNKWHPGQEWVWDAGGFGVFDPGINALSIATRIMPGRLFMRDAVMRVPEGRQAPIAAELTLASPAADAPIVVSLDWNPRADEEWTIRVKIADGSELVLSEGGGALSIDGALQSLAPADEYDGIYAEFRALLATRRSAADIEPLRLVADAFLIGRREAAPPFHWTTD